jgi:REP element-mobilizing transposase RayT
VRQRHGFVVAGYVVMPEHIHLLVSEPRNLQLSEIESDWTARKREHHQASAPPTLPNTGEG